MKMNMKKIIAVLVIFLFLIPASIYAEFGDAGGGEDTDMGGGEGWSSGQEWGGGQADPPGDYGWGPDAGGTIRYGGPSDQFGAAERAAAVASKEAEVSTELGIPDVSIDPKADLEAITVDSNIGLTTAVDSLSPNTASNLDSIAIGASGTITATVENRASFNTQYSDRFSISNGAENSFTVDGVAVSGETNVQVGATESELANPTENSVSMNKAERSLSANVAEKSVSIGFEKGNSFVDMDEDADKFSFTLERDMKVSISPSKHHVESLPTADFQKTTAAGKATYQNGPYSVTFGEVEGQSRVMQSVKRDTTATSVTMAASFKNPDGSTPLDYQGHDYSLFYNDKNQYSLIPTENLNKHSLAEINAYLDNVVYSVKESDLAKLGQTFPNLNFNIRGRVTPEQLENLRQDLSKIPSHVLAELGVINVYGTIIESKPDELFQVEKTIDPQGIAVPGSGHAYFNQYTGDVHLAAFDWFEDGKRVNAKFTYHEAIHAYTITRRDRIERTAIFEQKLGGKLPKGWGQQDLDDYFKEQGTFYYEWGRVVNFDKNHKNYDPDCSCWKDTRGTEAKNGYSRAYGASSIEDSIATFGEPLIDDPTFYDSFIDPKSPDFDASYLGQVALSSGSYISPHTGVTASFTPEGWAEQALGRVGFTQEEIGSLLGPGGYKEAAKYGEKNDE